MTEDTWAFIKKNCPDYVKIAEAYGANGLKAQSMGELEKDD